MALFNYSPPRGRMASLLPPLYFTRSSAAAVAEGLLHLPAAAMGGISVLFHPLHRQTRWILALRAATRSHHLCSMAAAVHPGCTRLSLPPRTGTVLGLLPMSRNQSRNRNRNLSPLVVLIRHLLDSVVLGVLVPLTAIVDDGVVGFHEWRGSLGGGVAVAEER